MGQLVYNSKTGTYVDSVTGRAVNTIDGAGSITSNVTQQANQEGVSYADFKAADKSFGNITGGAGLASSFTTNAGGLGNYANLTDSSGLVTGIDKSAYDSIQSGGTLGDGMKVSMNDTGLSGMDMAQIGFAGANAIMNYNKLGHEIDNLDAETEDYKATTADTRAEMANRTAARAAAKSAFSV